MTLVALNAIPAFTGETFWKDVALIVVGLLFGGLGGILRGEWLGRSAAKAVKEQVEGQISMMRGDYQRLENRVFQELQQLNEKVDRLLEREGRSR